MIIKSWCEGCKFLWFSIWWLLFYEWLLLYSVDLVLVKDSRFCISQIENLLMWYNLLKSMVTYPESDPWRNCTSRSRNCTKKYIWSTSWEIGYRNLIQRSSIAHCNHYHCRYPSWTLTWVSLTIPPDVLAATGSTLSQLQNLMLEDYGKSYRISV